MSQTASIKEYSQYFVNGILSVSVLTPSGSERSRFRSTERSDRRHGASVHAEVGAGDEGGRIGGKEHDGGSDRRLASICNKTLSVLPYACLAVGQEKMFTGEDGRAGKAFEHGRQLVACAVPKHQTPFDPHKLCLPKTLQPA